MDLTAGIGTHGIIKVTAQRAEIAALSWDHETKMFESEETTRMKIGVEETPLGKCSKIGQALDMIEGDKFGSAESPFKRSTVITRSPPLNGASGSNEQSVNMTKLGGRISQLMEFIAPRNNIHKDIHSMTREIHALYLLVSNELKCSSSTLTDKRLLDRETQTEAWPKTMLHETPTASAVKRGSKTQSPKGNKTKKKKDANHKYSESNKPTTTATEIVDTEAPNPEWKEVLPKIRKRKKIIKPDALIITACGDTSYADILKQVKRDPKLNVLGENVKNIRKTEKGELLLELNKPSHQNTVEFKTAIENVLGPDAAVRALTQEVLLEIKDIDEVTTREEVYEALLNVSEEFNILQMSAIKSMRTAYGSTQICVIGVNSVLANKLMETSKIRIGWVLCRIREKISPRRCYRCLNFGHTASRCKSTNDYTGLCIRCGEKGHKIKTCTKNAMCLLCKENGSDTNHITGAAVCPQYRKAFDLLKSR